jgi:hypothetical protein
MSYLAMGRANPSEEHALESRDFVTAGLPPLPSSFKRTPEPPPQSTRVRNECQREFAKGPKLYLDGKVPLTHFAREYEPQKKPKWSRPEPALTFERPKPTTRNFFHECPVLDLANKHALMSGDDETDTFILNGLSSVLLVLIGDCIDTVSTDFYGEIDNTTDVISPDNWGYGMDSIHDNGPSVDVYGTGKIPRYKTLWESGSKAAEIGKPWRLGDPSLLISDMPPTSQMDVAPKDGLRQVGQIESNEQGHLSTITARGKSKKIQTRVRAPRGKKQEEGPEHLAGVIAPNHSKLDKTTGTSSTNRPPVSDDHPMVVWEKAEREREHAHSVLDKLAVRLTPKLYNALIAAATGATLDAIGRVVMPGLARTNKQPGTAGKTMVITALDILLRDEDLKSELSLTMKLAA